ncbi:related to integral membrane protein [Rhynchosporium agropyri]|uniref:Related to integral membrane protein n=1 Tax=Rhynchosporium agropyri TaxID=914238 RepID=A0A1E1JRQ9_9HELO|nr:related to integral membrane protein [Rhynchosporium agropyri]
MSLAADGITYSAPPPPGHTPNFNQPHEGLDLIVCVGIFVSLAVVTTVIRIYTRTRIISELAADDYLMLLALACSIVLTAFALDLFNYGLGKHLWDVPIDVLYPHFLFNNLIAAIIYCPAAGFSKISILLFYRRIFRSRSFNRNIWILVTFTAAYSLSGMLVNIFSCRPIHGSWELSLATTAVCINRPIFYFSQAGLSIFTDFATLAVPLPFLRALQLPLKQKLGISVVLMMEATTPALMWCVIELNTSIIGGNFPTLKPFLKRYLPGLLGTSRGQKSASYIKSGSHNLQTFDKPPYAANGPKAFNRTTVTGMDKKARDDNESEEYIIQRSSHNSETELERTEQLGAGPSNRGINGAGRITKTVEYSLTTSKFERDQKY